MIVRHASDLKGTTRDVRAENWSTLRLLLKEDNMKFSMGDTLCAPGMDNILHYPEYLEACYCIEGVGSITDVSTAETHDLRPGTLYCFNEHVKHRLRAETRMRLISVFSPPLVGGETHGIRLTSDAGARPVGRPASDRAASLRDTQIVGVVQEVAMIVRRVEEVEATTNHVQAKDWSSSRLLTKGDSMGFTITDSWCEPGMDNTLCYERHLEACYCIEGEGSVEDLATREAHSLTPGTIYALDKHDRHRLKAKTRMRLICVFTPPLAGDEIHDEKGSY